MDLTCPLCESADTSLLLEKESREYHSCHTCRLIFVNPSQYLTREEEKARYDLHQNSPGDHRYREFLGPALRGVLKHLGPESSGLDFGSGPGPTLSVMFEEHGHRVALFDPFYANKPLILEKEYDFITATEVIEHMHCPRRDFKKIWSCLRRGGVLALMTKIVTDHTDFFNWYYKDDPTHVCFFSELTFKWLADNLNSEINLTDEGVALFFRIR